MMGPINRRRFLGAAASTGAALTLGASAGAAMRGANDRLIVGVMGTGGRGTGLARLYAQQKNVEVAYTCDADMRRAERASAEVAKATGGKAPKAVQDFRRLLDDKGVDVLVVATCNHWHAPAAILACAAGKHVYVEKPCSHNPREGELMVQAARKYDRRVQMGNQRRSWPAVQEAIEQLRAGAIGRVYLAQSWYTNHRGSIGKGKPGSPPEGLDYELWQGPAPRRPFHDNYLHYNWHWFWHWGNGELGNNGVHSIDICRWGLGVDYPLLVTSAGGRYRYEDDQQTPDTNTVVFNFEGRKTITWEGLSCSQPPDRKAFAMLFHGENGTLALTDGGYTVYDPKGKEVKKAPVSGSDAVHVGNFLDAIRSGAKLNSEIEEGHKSTLLCHLGNISYRTGRTLKCDPKSGHILGDKEAQVLWSREYEKGWEPKV
jgi:predicted dehydrogenase